MVLPQPVCAIFFFLAWLSLTSLFAWVSFSDWQERAEQGCSYPVPSEGRESISPKSYSEKKTKNLSDFL